MVTPNHSQSRTTAGDGPSTAATGTAAKTRATWAAVTVHDAASRRRSSQRRSEGPAISWDPVWQAGGR